MTEATAVVVVHVVVHVVVCAVVHKHHWLPGSMWERDIAEETLILFQETDTHCVFSRPWYLAFMVNNHLSVKVQPVFSMATMDYFLIALLLLL